MIIHSASTALTGIIMQHSAQELGQTSSHEIVTQALHMVGCALQLVASTQNSPKFSVCQNMVEKQGSGSYPQSSQMAKLCSGKASKQASSSIAGTTASGQASSASGPHNYPTAGPPSTMPSPHLTPPTPNPSLASGEGHDTPLPLPPTLSKKWEKLD